MDSSALFSHKTPGAVVAYRAFCAVDAQQFLADAADLAARLPSGRHVLNLCLDRYGFTVGLAACLMSERVSLLPAGLTPAVVRQLLQFAPDVFCLTDEASSSIELPCFRYAPSGSAPRLRRGAVPYRVPQIPSDQLVAIVFTSGSTGEPLPYKKTWGRLTRCIRESARRLGLLDGRTHTLIGTVPPQHMYGFETTVLLALLSGNSFIAERPFYPADVCATIAAAPRPRVLVSTPIHLRALLAAGMELPPLDLLVSATAPLARELAREAEVKFKSRLLEIYGSTETGQIAIRRTAECATWRLWPDVRLRHRDGHVYAEGGHLEQPTPMCDVLEITGEDEFLLHGRTADLVNVAGKRSSLHYLNAQLNAIPGVLDGVFFLNESAHGGITGVTRLAAAVVAPALSAAALIEELRRRLDPVFLPRPLLVVDSLPRNATGKVPHQALRSLAERHERELS